jgi:Protein of unknown function (DUF819)
MLLKSIVSGKLLQGALKLNAVLAISSKLEKLPFLSKLQIDSGTLSFMLGSACSSIAPNTFRLDPRFDEFGWTLCLQSALILGLWRANSKSSIFSKEAKSKKWIAILAAFLIGTLGSAVGGYLGYYSVASQRNVFLSEGSLSVLAACLTASYIGGTVNFFETAKILGVASCEVKKSLVNLVAGVDIGVMVMYFWVLGRLRTSFVRSLFPTEGRDSSTPLKSQLIEEVNEHLQRNEKDTIKAYIPSIIASVLISTLARLVQQRTKIPGASVIFATLAGKGFIELLSYIANKNPVDGINDVSNFIDTLNGGKSSCRTFWDKVDAIRFLRPLQEKARKAEKNLRTHSTQCSKYFMGLFYSTIGLGFRFDQIEAVQKPIMTLIGVTLSSHLIIMILGALLWNACVCAIFKKGPENSLAPTNLSEIIDKIDITLGESVQFSNRDSDDFLIDLDMALVAR